VRKVRVEHVGGLAGIEGFHRLTGVCETDCDETSSIMFKEKTKEEKIPMRKKRVKKKLKKSKRRSFLLLITPRSRKVPYFSAAAE